MIDCGADWLGQLEKLSPSAIVLTHAHPDHAQGLADGAPCPVYMTDQTSSALLRYPIVDRRKMPLRNPVFIDGLCVEAFPVQHSTRAPAVGYRISAGTYSLFYVPDVAAIPSQSLALRGAQLYIGDGASILRPIVKRREALIGHSPIQMQLRWCKEEHVPEAIFTHCGSQIVKGDGRRLGAIVRRLGREHGIVARIAHDGMRFELKGCSSRRCNAEADRPSPARGERAFRGLNGRPR
jgi:phosphoribosyl 1,2-cyclic phosphodiesterase